MTRFSRFGVTFTAALLLVATGLTLFSHRTVERLQGRIGMVRTVYGTPEFQSPIASRYALDVTLAFLDDHPDWPTQAMSVRWTGFWLLQETGPIFLYAYANDAVSIWIDGQLVVHRAGPDYDVLANPVQLEAGVHELQIDYVQHDGGRDLRVQWAPEDLDRLYRPLGPYSLFPVPPAPSLVAAASRARTFEVLEWGGWVAVMVSALAFVVLPGAVRVWRSGWPARWVHNRTVRRRSFFVTGLVLVIWAMTHRAGALNPMTIWSDDIWVATLASLPSFVDAVTTPAPVPPGFVALQWASRHLVPDPEVSLQLIPLAAGLAIPCVLCVLVLRVTRSAALALSALSLGLLDPFMAQVSVFSKQYTFDGLLAILLLGLAVKSLDDRPVPIGRAAGFGTLALLFSFPSIFVSWALVHILAWRTLGARREGKPVGLSTLGIVIGFNTAVLAVYLFVLRPRSGQALQRYWRRDFIPAGTFERVAELIASRGREMVEQALPVAFVDAAPLFAVGLIWLLLHARYRMIGIFLLVSYASLYTAAVLDLYPIGQGYRGRVVLFSNPLVIFLVAVGAHAVTGFWRRGSMLNAGLALMLIVSLYRSPVTVSYFDHDHSDLVREVLAHAGPDDAVVLNRRASYLVGVYTDWPSKVVRNDTTEGYHLEFARPLTLTLQEGAETDEDLRSPLTALLDRERPERVFLLVTRRDSLSLEATIRQAGYEPTHRRASTTSTRLVEYRLMSSATGQVATLGVS